MWLARLPVPRTVLAAVVCWAVLMGACTAGPGAGGATPRDAGGGSGRRMPATPPSSGSALQPSHSSPAPPQNPGFVPDPARRIPGRPVPMAAVLTTTNRALRNAIDRWVGGGRPSTPRPPADVVLLALYQQRVSRLLARDGELARRTLALLPRGLAGAVRANVGAARDLFSLVSPLRRPNLLHVQRPAPAGRLLGFFREAERRFGVDWELLAAVMFVESKFGRTRSDSAAGAQGPMQFVPSTWAAYGLGGDVRDPHDAILGAANYLNASGAPHDERGALFAYNHAGAYVDAVEAYGNQMRREADTYFDYYNWQVFVVTTSGDIRLTGPGRS
jgi:soluble lytic murein transglycosylase-like protein